MDSLEKCRILLGLSADNEKKLAVLEVCLEKAKDDICDFCRDTFYDEEGHDVFPKTLKNVQEDLAIIKYRKRGAEGETSYSLSDENVSFDDPLPDNVKQRLYPYRRVFPRIFLPVTE